MSTSPDRSRSDRHRHLRTKSDRPMRPRGMPRSSVTSAPDVGGVAADLQPMIEALIGEPGVGITFWDGSALGPTDGPGALHVRSPEAIAHVLWAPGELGLGRAFVSGAIDVDGDVLDLIEALRPAGRRLGNELRVVPKLVGPAMRLHLLGRPPAPPPEEARPRGRKHTRSRDADAISHHYDVGNDFYRLVLGEAMTYSCAYFADPAMGLAEAQAAKHELICRKLGLADQPGLRLLDVGCGWGSMAIHAARHHDASVVGITISREQADLARQRVARRRARRPGRDPAPGLPGPTAARRFDAHLVGRHVRARRQRADDRVLRDAARGRSSPPAGCSTTPSRRSGARGSAGGRSSAATCSPTAS